jgi:hypothetical protein
MSWFDKIMGAKGTKEAAKQEDVTAQVKAKLKGIVYDDSIVEELLPVFMKLKSSEGFEKVIELLETKERQIEAMTGGEWFKQETDPDNKEADNGNKDAVITADDILKSKFEGK